MVGGYGSYGLLGHCYGYGCYGLVPKMLLIGCLICLEVRVLLVY